MGGVVDFWQHCTLLPPGQRFVFQVPPAHEARDLSRHWPELSLQAAWMQHLTPTGSLGQASMTVKPCDGALPLVFFFPFKKYGMINGTMHTSHAAIIRFASATALRSATDVADAGDGDADEDGDDGEGCEKHDLAPSNML